MTIDLSVGYMGPTRKEIGTVVNFLQDFVRMAGIFGGVVGAQST